MGVGHSTAQTPVALAAGVNKQLKAPGKYHQLVGKQVESACGWGWERTFSFNYECWQSATATLNEIIEIPAPNSTS